MGALLPWALGLRLALLLLPFLFLFLFLVGPSLALGSRSSSSSSPRPQPFWQGTPQGHQSLPPDDDDDDDGRGGRAFFTETPHDMTARAGEDVEMACSFRGSGSPSYSLEIQWWYVRTHKDWTDKQSWASNQLKASPQEEARKEATKISVVKVVGSNISHKLRLSRVKPTDEGTYECRVIDFSDSKARHHKVKAYLRVEAEEKAAPRRHSAHGGHLQDTQQQQQRPLGAQTSEHSKLSAPHPQHQHHHKPGKELKKRSLADDASCAL